MQESDRVTPARGPLRQLRLDVLIIFGKLAALLFVEEDFAVAIHDKAPVVEWAECERVEIRLKISHDIGHQPGGHRVVLSSAAILDFNVHEKPSWRTARATCFTTL